MQQQILKYYVVNFEHLTFLPLILKKKLCIILNLNSAKGDLKTLAPFVSV